MCLVLLTNCYHLWRHQEKDLEKKKSPHILYMNVRYHNIRHMYEEIG